MPETLLTVSDAKRALKLKDDDRERDQLLETSFLPGVLDVIEEEVGWVAAREVTVEVTSRAGVAVLRRTNVRQIIGATDLAGAAADVSSAVVASETGIVYGLPVGPLRLTLAVGFEEIPESIRRGAAEVLIAAWETQRSNEEPRPFLLPYRAEAWLKPHSMGPSIR